MALDTFTSLVEIDPGLGAVIPAIGTNIVVAITDSKQISSGTAGQFDPWSVMGGGSGSGMGNIRPIRVPNRCAFVDFFHVYRAGNTAIATSLKMRCAGLVPPGKKHTTGGEHDVWPHDADSNYTDVDQFFLPLIDSSGATEVEFGTTASYGDLSYGTSWGVQGPKSFYLAGSKLIVPFVSQAMAGPTAGLVIARFTS